MTIQAMEKAIENLEYKVAKLEFEVYEQRRTIGQLIMEKADRKTEPQKWETPPKFEHKGIITTCVSVPLALIMDEPKTCDTCKYADREWYEEPCNRCGYMGRYEPQTDCSWK